MGDCSGGSLPRREETVHRAAMPLMLEVKYEYFITSWPGRIKLTELFLALFCMMCAAPGYEGPQHWFLLVVVLSFLAATFFSFTAFVAILAHFAEMDGGEYQYWVDAQIAAGVFGLLNDIVYGFGAYLIYVEWKTNPVGVA